MDTGKPNVGATGIATAVAAWLVTLALALLFTIDAFGRFIVQRPLPFEVSDLALRVAGGLLVVVICIGVVDVLAALFDGQPADNADPRTRLAFWPGHGLAFAATVVAAVVTATAFGGGLRALPVAALGDHVSGALLFAVAVPAMLAPARLRGALAVMALPLAGLVMLAMAWDVSLGGAMLQMLVVLLPVGILLLVVGLAAGVPQLAWGAASALILLFILGPILLGVTTPTEILAVAALLAIPVGFGVQATQASGDMKQALVDGGREMAAVAAILLMSMMVGRLLTFLGWTEVLAAAALNLPWPVAAALLVVIVTAIGYVATPMLAIGLCGFVFGPAVRFGGYEPGKVAVLIVMAGLLAAVLRIVPATAAAERSRTLPAVAATVAGIVVITAILLALVRLPSL